MKSELAKDLLVGATEISEFLGAENWPVHRIYYCASKGHLPVTYIGTMLTSTKSRLIAHFAGDAAVNKPITT
jgi:hypothetical protein